ncbi:MAG: fluoride efflux transporter CrcB [Phycisphaeraceae bacterium]|nr:fluoride efflux transporter CrcB [Phycisphaeraceae bacterium]MCB9847738.1 fluoride efflux transporter CrcB [Phycisphaeraceae bacterium]
MLTKLALVAVGGGAGAVARFLLSLWVNRLVPNFPGGTLAVNLLGCLCIGLAMPLFAGHDPRFKEEWRLLLAIGFLGAFTTFSTFAYETFAEFDAGQLPKGLANIAVSVVGGLALVWVGYAVSDRLLSGG